MNLFRHILAPLFIAPLFFTGTAAMAATVNVTVENILSDRGFVDIALCSKDQFLGDRCTFKKSAAAEKGSMAFTLKQIPPGRYAVQVHHDLNANGKMDWDMLGLFPSEPYGFTRIKGPLYAEPKFVDTSFIVTRGEPADVTVTLTNP